MKPHLSATLLLSLAGLFAVALGSKSSSVPASEISAITPRLEEGDVVAIRQLQLKEGADTKSFEKYIAEVYTPAFKKHVPGVESFILRAERGQNKGRSP